jgi:hypothetical protein
MVSTKYHVKAERQLKIKRKPAEEAAARASQTDLTTEPP